MKFMSLLYSGFVSHDDLLPFCLRGLVMVSAGTADTALLNDVFSLVAYYEKHSRMQIRVQLFVVCLFVC